MIRVAVAALALLGCAPPVAPPAIGEVPELARAVDVDPDPDVVEVELWAGPELHEILPGVQTPGLAYRDLAAGSPEAMPGPLVEVAVGQTLEVWLTNDLGDVQTTLHFHGMRTPVELDGNPIVRTAIPPGRTMLHRFVVQDAGLYWFHPHVASDEHVELGLQGLVVVRAPGEPRASRERIFVLDDVDLAPDGSIDLQPGHDDHHFGRHGEQLLVNGRPPGRVAAIAGSVERWRFVNTANGRHFALSLGGRAFEVIGLDGPALEQPYETDVLELAPGERRDVLVRIDGAAGSAMWLETLPVDRGEGQGEWEAAELVRLDVAAGDPGPVVRASDFGRPVERLPIEGALARRVVLEADLHAAGGPVMTINGAIWPFGEPLEASYGDVEVWEVVNTSDLRHPFHVHGTFFQIVDRNGVRDNVLGWRDTMGIAPLETVRIAMRYDALGRWMFHCQIPEHAHMGMMGDLVVRE